MPILFQDNRLAFNVYSFSGSEFNVLFQLYYEEILNSTLTVNIDNPVLELQIKNKKRFEPFFTSTDLLLIERVVEDKSNGKKANKLYVLVDRSYSFSNAEQKFEIKALDLQGLKSKKIIGTTENVISPDPDNLPDNFYKYKDSSQFDNVIANLYDRVFKTPQTLAYGQLLSTDNDRKLKGLENINVESQSTLSKDLQYDANATFFDTEQDILELFNLTNRSEIDLNSNNLIDINVKKPKTLSINLISNPEEVQSLNYKIIKSDNFANLYHTTSEPNLYSTSKNLQNNEVTTFELTEDVSFTAGNNQTYIDNSAFSGLQKNNKSVDFDLELKFNILTHFIDYNLNDIIQIQGINLVSGNYRILEIVENISVESVDVVVKLDFIN